MKKLILFTAGFVMFFAFGVMAQVTPKASGRQAVQQVRIAEGVKSGELTKAERRALKAEQRHIRRTKRRAKANGVVTPREKKAIQRKQNRANRHIRRQKHDDDVR